MTRSRYGLEMEHPDDGYAINRTDAVIMASLFVVALAIRLLSLPQYQVISNDGTAYVTVARGLRNFDFSGIGNYGFYPVLVWLAGMVVPDLELAGRIVSILFGALLCIPVYLLGAELFSRRTAAAACMVVIVWPSLRHWSCEVMTQSTYTALAMTGTYFVWRMMRSSSVKAAICAGLSLGIAYATRTEAVLLLFILPLPLMIAFRRELRARIPVLAAYAGAFAAVAAANLILVHHATGSWQLASKTSVALIDAISYIQGIPDLNYIPGVAPTSYLEILLEFPSFIVTNSVRNVVQLFKTLIPLPFWVLLAAGIVSGGLSGGRNLVRLFLLSTCAPLAVLIVYYYIGPEYTQPYIPVILLFCAEGLRSMEEFLAGRLPVTALPAAIRRWLPFSPLTTAAAFVFALVTLVSQIPSGSASEAYVPHNDGGRRDQKHLGLVLKKNLPPGKIMTRWARIAFYAEREWAMIPKADLKTVVAEARKAGVRFLIVDGGLWELRPELDSELFDPFVPGAMNNGIYLSNSDNSFIRPGLRPFLLYLNDPGSMGVAVYEIIG